MTGIGVQQVSAEQWYASIAASLVSSFDLKIQFGQWWREQAHLTFVNRLEILIETVLLRQVTQNIVIFIDEIDSVLALKFPADDFFALIRACYNQRSEKPEFNRLSFALLGVTTPADLISDKQRTPFNIGRAIELSGFQFTEATPLLTGLSRVAKNPEAVLRHILNWTGGQPFLTQKLCDLVVRELTEQDPFLMEEIDPIHISELTLEHLFHIRMIENWEAQDRPEHLRTIRDRLLSNDEQTGRLLELYQQILQSPRVSIAGYYPLFEQRHQGIAIDNSVEQITLTLSGLVEKVDGYLRIKNPIYEAVFNARWIDRQFAKLRPYSEALSQWKQSLYQDTSRLLHGQALIDAQTWSTGKHLSDEDYRFLTASQTFQEETLRRHLEADRAQEMAVRLQLENRNTKLQQRLLALLSLGLVTSIFLSAIAFLQYRRAARNEVSTLTSNSELLYTMGSGLDALVVALRARAKVKDLNLQDKTTLREVDRVLRQAVFTGAEFNRFSAHTGSVRCVNFSPDGEFFATCSEDQTVKLWHTDGTLVTTLKGHLGSLLAVSFSPDGKLIASGSTDNSVRLWSHDGWQVERLLGHQGNVQSVAFSPDSSLLASASADHTVKLWSRDGALIRTLHGHQGTVNAVRFSPDGNVIATASADRTIKFWTRDGVLLKTLTGHRDPVSSIAFSPDGKEIASVSLDDTIRVWTQAGELLRTIEANSDGVTDLAWSPNSQTIATVGFDKALKVWQRNGILLRTLRGHGQVIWSVAFHPTGDEIVTGSGDKTARLWRLSNGLLTRLEGHTSDVNQVEFSPDGRQIVTASKDRTIKLWGEGGNLVRDLVRDFSWKYDAKFSPDGKEVISAGLSGMLRRWRLDGAAVAPIPSPSGETIQSIAYSPNGNLIASGGQDKTLRIWETGGKLVRSILAHDTAIQKIAFAPGGNLVATASSDGTVKLWKVEDGSLRASLIGHQGEITAIAFSDSLIATGSSDRLIKLWRLDGTLLNTLEGHQDNVLGLAFRADGQVLASGSLDKTAKLWGVDGHLITTLNGHTEAVRSVAFHPDGKLLASASSDRTVILWNLNQVLKADSAVTACHWLKNYLTTNSALSEHERSLCRDVDLSKPN
jgi:WD40 repeat protein